MQDAHPGLPVFFPLIRAEAILADFP